MSISCARLIEPFRSGLADPSIASRICWKLSIDFNGRSKILSRHCDFQRSVMSQSVRVCMVKQSGFHRCQLQDRRACIPGPKRTGQNSSPSERDFCSAYDDCASYCVVCYSVTCMQLKTANLVSGMSTCSCSALLHTPGSTSTGQISTHTVAHKIRVGKGGDQSPPIYYLEPCWNDVDDERQKCWLQLKLLPWRHLVVRTFVCTCVSSGVWLQMSLFKQWIHLKQCKRSYSLESQAMHDICRNACFANPE